MAELLQTAVHQAFNAVLITNADLHGPGPLITYCNPAFCAMTGYTESELLGQPPSLLQGPLTDPQVLQRLREALRSGGFFQGSTFNYRKDGSSYLVEWNISPVRDPQGRIQHFVSVQHDITARIQAEQRQALLAKALNATHDAVLIANHQAQILFTNQAFEQLTGYAGKEVLGSAPSFVQADQPPPAFYQHLRETLLEGKKERQILANRHKNGDLRHIEQAITTLHDETGKTRHYVSVIKDVSDFVRREHQLHEQAHRDALTGLYNRRGATVQLQHCQRGALSSGNPYALILGDIDDFKRINDIYGHEAGDEVLQQCAAMLDAQVRRGDAVARWGGEEFLIILPDCPLIKAVELAERIRRAIADYQHPSVGPITLSMGVGGWQASELSETLLRRTDQALYQAKAAGRNRVIAADWN